MTVAVAQEPSQARLAFSAMRPVVQVLCCGGCDGAAAGGAVVDAVLSTHRGHMPTLCLDLRDASVHIGDRFTRGSKANVHFRTASDHVGHLFNLGISALLKQSVLCLQLRIAHWACVGGRALHWTRLVFWP